MRSLRYRDVDPRSRRVTGSTEWIPGRQPTSTRVASRHSVRCAIRLECRIGLASAVVQVTEHHVTLKVVGIQRDRMPDGRKRGVVPVGPAIHHGRERSHDRRAWIDRARPLDLRDRLVVTQRIRQQLRSCCPSRTSHRQSGCGTAREGAEPTARGRFKKAIEIPAESADPEKLPPILQGFKAVAPLVTDINLSIDDRSLSIRRRVCHRSRTDPERCGRVSRDVSSRKAQAAPRTTTSRTCAVNLACRASTFLA